jgi:hypothetical protein
MSKRFKNIKKLILNKNKFNFFKKKTQFESYIPKYYHKFHPDTKNSTGNKII